MSYLFRIGALLSLLVLARLADRAQQTGLAATGLSRPARASHRRPAAQPLAGLPAYRLVSRGGR